MEGRGVGSVSITAPRCVSTVGPQVRITAPLYLHLFHSEHSSIFLKVRLSSALRKA